MKFYIEPQKLAEEIIEDYSCSKISILLDHLGLRIYDVSSRKTICRGLSGPGKEFITALYSQIQEREK